MQKHKIRIHGDVWTYSIVDTSSYIRRNGTDSSAITDTNARTIEFLPNAIDIVTVIHELVHAHMVYLCLEDTRTMPVADYEEVVATFIGRNLLTLLKDSVIVYHKLNKLEFDSYSFKYWNNVLGKLWKKL